MRAFPAAGAIIVMLVSAPDAVAQTIRTTATEAHWKSGVVQLAIKADLPDDCTRLVRAIAKGVTTRTLAVEVTVVREPTAQCGRSAGRVERSYSYNFPGITQAATAVTLRFLRDGQELGRETTPIAASTPIRR
ncbi:hypothetical protein [Phreatobacter stygius]|uniref:UrcA family protein n=1 Tax=Phreatobacter stygius TaxID=1940610 RepID=A0A4D7B3J4_9HYPH|nr:hypothetical protein [Phreatobacter stygius]QCI68074.1 hypothetical protein E8M01_29900 [Phreatobacter stygius]